MIIKTEPTYWVKIYMSGPIAEAEHVCRKYCLSGLCVTIEPVKYIYTGGEESGFVIGLINYPRFPTTQQSIWDKAIELSGWLLDATHQHSALIMSPEQTEWRSVRQS